MSLYHLRDAIELNLSLILQNAYNLISVSASSDTYNDILKNIEERKTRLLQDIISLYKKNNNSVRPDHKHNIIDIAIDQVLNTTDEQVIQDCHMTILLTLVECYNKYHFIYWKSL